MKTLRARRRSAPSLWECNEKSDGKLRRKIRQRDRVSIARRSGNWFAVRQCEQAKKTPGCLKTESERWRV